MVYAAIGKKKISPFIEPSMYLIIVPAGTGSSDLRPYQILPLCVIEPPKQKPDPG